MKIKTLHTLVWKENNWYIAKLLELELASQGKTKDEAIANLGEATELYLENEGLGIDALISPAPIEEVSVQILPLT